MKIIRLRRILLVLCCAIRAVTVGVGASRIDANGDSSADLAIVAVIGEDDSGYADVVFAALAEEPALRLVDRDTLWAIMREADLHEPNEQNAVTIGRLVRADALVFVRVADDRLIVRGVETARGVRLIDLVDDATPAAAEVSAAHAARIMASRAALLRTVTERRHYVAIAPLFMRSGRGDQLDSAMQYLGDLMSALLSALPDVVLVERDTMERVAFEQALDDDASPTQLQQADWVLRGGGEWDANGVLTVRLHLTELPDRQSHYSEPFVLDREDPTAGLQALLQWCMQTLASAVAPASRIDLTNEAEVQYFNAQRYLTRIQRDAALRALRAAYMLDPDRFAWSFATELWKGPEQPATIAAYAMMTEALDIAQFKLRARGCVFPIYNPADGMPSGEALSAIRRQLRSVPLDLRDDERAVIATFRRRFQGYMEWLHRTGDVSRYPTAQTMLQIVSPYFFDTPTEAINYLRELTKHTSMHRSPLIRSDMLEIRHWDMELARTLWIEFLHDYALARDDESSYIALRRRGELLMREPRTGLAGYTRDEYTADAIEASRELVKWMAGGTGRHLHATSDMGYGRAPLFRGFLEMDAAFQREYLGPWFMDHAGAWPSGGNLWLYTVLQRILKAHAGDPEVQAEVAGHLDTYLRLRPLKAMPEDMDWRTLPFHRQRNTREYLTETFPDVAALLPEWVSEEVRREDIEFIEWYDSNYSRVFDWDGMPQHLRTVLPQPRNVLSTICNDYLWLLWSPGFFNAGAWHRLDESILVRIDSRTDTVEYSSFTAARPRRWAATSSHLVCATESRVYSIPLGADNRYPRFDEATEITGLPSMGNILNITKPSGMTAALNANHHMLTLLYARDDRVYLAFSPGMLYVWTPDMPQAERVLRYDDIIPGPLTDTNPYIIVDGIKGDSPNVNYFRIISFGGQLRGGWWRYDRNAESPWEWLSDAAYSGYTEPKHPINLSVWRSHLVRGMLIQDLEYYAGPNQVRRFARASRPESFDPRVHDRNAYLLFSMVCANDHAAFWIVQAQGVAFRVYRIKREHWPK